jgi:hypothetical protein
MFGKKAKPMNRPPKPRQVAGKKVKNSKIPAPNVEEYPVPDDPIICGKLVQKRRRGWGGYGGGYRPIYNKPSYGEYQNDSPMKVRDWQRMNKQPTQIQGEEIGWGLFIAIFFIILLFVFALANSGG